MNYNCYLQYGRSLCGRAFFRMYAEKIYRRFGLSRMRIIRFIKSTYSTFIIEFVLAQIAELDIKIRVR